jgi:hypothetical protein
MKKPLEPRAHAAVIRYGQPSPSPAPAVCADYPYRLQQRHELMYFEKRKGAAERP